MARIRHTCRYAMDTVDWAMNVAQINRDIRLANEHLPPGMQVCRNVIAVQLPDNSNMHLKCARLCWHHLPNDSEHLRPAGERHRAASV